MLKEQLLQEAAVITTEVKLDNIFESVDLTPEVKQQFQLVFETSVKKTAIDLAESHITAIAEKAEADVLAEVETKSAEIETKLKETCDTFLKHLASQWLTENAVEVDKSIKSNLFESMFVGLKGLFVEHNVVLPAESVDIVAEMENELQEAKSDASDLFTQLQESKAHAANLERTALVEKATVDLTESQKEKVLNLIEGVEFDDKYETKLVAMVEMAKAKTTSTDKPIVESASQLDESAGLNFTPATDPAAAKPAQTVDPMMAQFIAHSTAQ